jgi:hypothetical protein
MNNDSKIIALAIVATGFLIAATISYSTRYQVASASGDMYIAVYDTWTGESWMQTTRIKEVNDRRQK